MNLIKLIVTFTVFAIFLSGCSNSYENQIDNIPDSIEVSYETGPQISQNQNLMVWIKNQTNFCLSFPPDYGIKIYFESSNGWKEVPNLGKYLGTEPQLLKSKNDLFSEDAIVARPDIAGLGLTQPTDFYVSISGNLCDDETLLIEKKIPFVVVP